MNVNLEIGPVQQLEDHIKAFEEVYSPSELDTFQRCRRKHHLGYNLRLGEPGPAIAADAGTIIHAGIATLWKTADVDVACAEIKRLHGKLYAWCEPAGYDLPKQYKLDHLLRVFIKYGMEVYRQDTLPPIGPEYVEVGFIITITDPVGRVEPFKLYGRMDWLGKSTIDGHVAPVDTKTTKSWGSDFAARFDPFLQGDLYTYVTKKMLTNERVTGFYINGVLLQITKMEFNRVFIPRKPIDLEEFERETIWWIQQIREARLAGWYPKSTNQCTAFGECAFRRVCTSHMLENVIDKFPKRPPKGFHFSEGE